MKQFLTERISDKWCGETLDAESWEIAEKMCPEGYQVIGELDEIIDGPELDRTTLEQLLINIERIKAISNRLLALKRSR